MSFFLNWFKKYQTYYSILILKKLFLNKKNALIKVLFYGIHLALDSACKNSLLILRIYIIAK